MVNLHFVCNQSWDAMTPVEGGRLCASCSKILPDFTAMSDEQISTYIRINGAGCGSFRADQTSDGQTYGGWKLFSKWKTSLALLMAGSVFLLACRQRTSGMYETHNYRLHRPHWGKQDSMHRVRAQFLIDEKFRPTGDESDSY